jgi:CRISPR type II-A-associated protein Csn2
LKLVHKFFDKQFDFTASNSHLLVIEDPKYLYEVIAKLFRQLTGEKGDFVLSENNKEIILAGNAQILFEPFSLDPNSSRVILNKLISRSKRVAYDEDHLLETNKLINTINKWAVNLLDAQQYSFEVTCGEEFAVDDLLKALKPQIELPDQSLAEKLTDYFIILRDLLSTQLFILVGFSAYLSKEEMQLLIKQIAYDDQRVLFIESSYLDLDIPQVIISSEGCEI